MDGGEVGDVVLEGIVLLGEFVAVAQKNMAAKNLLGKARDQDFHANKIINVQIQIQFKFVKI